MVSWHNINLHADIAVVLELAILALAAHGHPKAVVVLEFKVHRVTLHVVLKVALVDAKGSLGQVGVLKGLLEVNDSAADDVVALEEVTVERLDLQSVVLARQISSKQESIVEAGLAVLATIVTVCLEGVLVV